MKEIITTAVKNICEPESVFGSFQQTLFLGLSVSGFSASAGLNGQQSEITIALVEDKCAPPANKPKIYYDKNLKKQEWTEADPGFYGLTYDLIGSPLYFRLGDFEFSGIMQSYQEIHSESANPTYHVKLVDPTSLLQNAQLIVQEYAGNIDGVFNIFNIYGYLENLSIFSCPSIYQSAPQVYIRGDSGPDGAVFGSEAGGYAGANVTNSGMAVTDVIRGIIALTSELTSTSNPWSVARRLVFRGPSSVPVERMGIIQPTVGKPYSDYIVDVSALLEILPSIPDYWRVESSTLSILDFISEICNDAIYDFYVELLPTYNAEEDYIHNVIKLRVINRSVKPTNNTIQTFIDAEENRVIDYNTGKELRNEVTSSLVIGGKKQSFYQATNINNDVILPYFGTYPNGDVIIPYLNSGDPFFKVSLPTKDLQVQLSSAKYSRTIPDNVIVDEREMMCAESGYDVWSAYASMYNTSLWQALNVNANLSSVFYINQLVSFFNKNVSEDNQMSAADFINTGRGGPKMSEIYLEIAQIGYAWLSNIVSSYFGKSFQVAVPWTCSKIDAESGTIIHSESPSDGGWTNMTSVLDLNHQSVYTDFFSLPDNRLGAFCKILAGNGIDLANINQEDFIYDNGILWIKTSVSDKYVFEDASANTSPRVVITLPNAIRPSVGFDNSDINFNAGSALLNNFGKDGLVNRPLLPEELEKFYTNVGTISATTTIPLSPIMPQKAGFGILSNILCYGPWSAFPSDGTAGPTRVIYNDGLVPWAYGSSVIMQEAAESISLEGISNQQVVEEGSVSIVGYPTKPLLSELLYDDPTHPFENRNTSEFSIFSLYPDIKCLKVNKAIWDGSYGPNITSINVNVGTQGITTQYAMRVWTPKFGKFSRNNAERLRRAGLNNLAYNKSMRLSGTNTLFFSHYAAANAMITGHYSAMNSMVGRHQSAMNSMVNTHVGAMNSMVKSRWGSGNHTPSQILVGQNITWNTDWKRPVVAMMPIQELGVEIANKYDQKAIMSLDGLIRPVSTDGSGGLSQYVTPNIKLFKASSRSAQPPIDIEGEAGTYNLYNQEVNVDYLNPFTNPDSDIVTNNSDTPNIGHDIEIVGRGAEAPSDSMALPIQGFVDTEDVEESNYSEEYRMLALRGPLLIHGWGYDLDGFPVPNKNEEPDNPVNKFADNWLRTPNKWPVGPLDVRWDKDRGVWTFPEYRDLVVLLKETLVPFGSAIAEMYGPEIYDDNGDIIERPEVYDDNGDIIEHPEVLVKDKNGNRADEGTYVIARFNKDDCSYYVINQDLSSWILYTPPGGIPGRQGLICGSAVCTIWYINDFDVLVNTSIEVPVKNIFSGHIEGNTYITAKIVRGKLVVDAEDC